MYAFIEGFEYRSPAADSSIADCEVRMGVKLPDDYVEFLRFANGGEGFVADLAYLILWRVEDLVRNNEGYRVKEYVPGLFIFGSDGGGEAYGFDTRSAEWRIVTVPFVGMDWSMARSMGDSFHAFIQNLSQSRLSRKE